MTNIIISGASRGIGRYLYDNLSKNYNVIGFSKEPTNQNKIYKCDVRNFENVEKTFSKIKNEVNQVFSLINCAGILSTGLLISKNYKNINEMIDVNLKGTIFCSKQVLKMMIKNGSGRIINFSSIASFQALEGDSVYSSTKAAINIFTKSLAKEVAKKNITVNAIAPGFVSTDMTSNMTLNQKNELINSQVTKKEVPLNEILNVINFLLSNESRFITGEVITIG
jgi:3-oxoacyl-[acyl-carrier protein] reductase